MTDLAGYVTAGGPGCGLIQQFGNFPRAGENPDEPGNNFEASVRAGYTFDGQFLFRSADVSAGQQVLFDLAEDTGAVYACNIRVP
jgi:hypothetical protein